MRKPENGPSLSWHQNFGNLSPILSPSISAFYQQVPTFCFICHNPGMILDLLVLCVYVFLTEFYNFNSVFIV